ncbi:hypothetical protein SBA2_840007 [Acidobacteriia bacterium SbA2]|nr:hypothetical protein SBA2_840007 [Acidobacteriia bacterium SbA2]
MTPSISFNFRLIWQGLRRSSFRRGRASGSALFEFLLVFPVLALFLIGIIYGGITFYDYEELANAVTIGAKTLVTNRGAGSGGSTGQTACVLEENALKAAAANFAPTQITIVESFPTPATGSTPTCSNLILNDTATVSATYPCNLYFPALGINLCSMPQGNIKNGTTIITTCPYTYCISSSTTLRIE